MSDPIEPPDPDLDDLTRDQLDGSAAAVARVLDDWLLRLHGIKAWGHNVGTFLEGLAAAGYRVEPIRAASVQPNPRSNERIIGMTNANGEDSSQEETTEAQGVASRRPRRGTRPR